VGPVADPRSGAPPARPDEAVALSPRRGHPEIVRRHPEIVRLLPSRGADLEAIDAEHRSTALGWAAFHGFPGVAEVLLAAGARVDRPNRYGVAPLDLALSGARGEQSAQYGIQTPREAYEIVA